MKSKAMQERIKSLLKETITLLCKNGLEYRSQFCIEALIGITLDEEDIVLVNINETVSTIVAEADSAHVAMSSGASVSLCSHTEDGPDLDSHSRSHRHRRKTKRHSTDRGPTPKKLLKGSPSPRSQASTFRERDVNSSSRHGRQLTLRPHVDTTENDDSKSDIVYIKEEPEDDNDRNGEAVWSSVTPASLSMSLPLNPPLASSESRTAHPVSEGNIHMLGNSGDEKIKIEGVARWVAQQQFQQEQDEGGNLGAPEGTTVSSAQHGPPAAGSAVCAANSVCLDGHPSLSAIATTMDLSLSPDILQLQKEYALSLPGGPFPLHEEHITSPAAAAQRDSSTERGFAVEDQTRQCSVCFRWFGEELELRRHLQAEHHKATYQCGRCCRFFLSRYSCSQHEASCGQSAGYACSVCSKQFTRTDNLNVHIRKLHGDLLKFACVTCRKKFLSQEDLDSHKCAAMVLNPNVL